MTDVKQMARDLLAFYGGDERRWTKGAFARTVDGYPVKWSSPEGVCFCLMGASFRCGYGGLDTDELADMLEASGLPSLNDHESTTFRTVEAALKRIAEAP